MSLSQPPPVRPLAVLCAMAFTSLIEDLHRRLSSKGITDLRPAHGFVFQKVAGAGATAAEIALHLGITRQSTQQIIEELIGSGYLQRDAHPIDRRSKIIRLTSKGLESLAVVEEAFQAIDRRWVEQLGRTEYAIVSIGLRTIAEAGHVTGPLRPVW